MCGICGFWADESKDTLQKMTDILQHRGPDDYGYHLSGDLGGKRVGLGHRRLSIIDLSPSGRQPMTNEDGSLWLTYNGEIYNFQEIRKRLIDNGHKFKSDTDSEILLHLYEEKGVDLVHDLNGIFAFALWDENERRLFLARDRTGVKPLYYTQKNGCFLFASEVKSLLCSNLVERGINYSALPYYLNFRYVPDPLTMFEGIKKLPPAHFCIVNESGVRIERYWQYTNEIATNGRLKNADSQVLALLKESVKSQLISDVPVGLLFSGGLDSSAILALMHDIGVNDIKTFTVGFKSEDRDIGEKKHDIDFARDLAKKFGVDSEEIILDPSVIDLLPKIIWHLDEPIADPAVFSSYLIAETAKSKVKVLLSGQGSDEIFAGYPWHLAMKLSLFYSRMSKILPNRLLENLIDRHLKVSAGHRSIGTLRRLKKFMKSASLPDYDRYIGFCSYADPGDIAGLFSGAARERMNGSTFDDIHKSFLFESENTDIMNQVLYLDFHTFLPSLNLAYTDKTSMAHSIEVRVPFLDNRMVDFVSKLPSDLKLHRTNRKHILKKALEPLLPKEFIYRKKQGFGAPIRTWVNRDLKDMIGDLLSPKRVKERGLFSYDQIARLISDNSNGIRDYNYLIYSLLNFELWAETFMDGSFTDHSKGLNTVNEASTAKL